MMFQKHLIAAAILAIGVIGSGPAHADGCEGVTTVAGTTQEGVTFKAGYHFDEISIGSTNPDGSVAWYDEAGGYTYPAQDVKLLNCRLSTDNNGNDILVFDNTDAGQSAQIASNTEQELENAGIDDAEAGNFSDYAYQHPQSTCVNDIDAILNAAQALSAEDNIPTDQRDDQWNSANNTTQQQYSNAENRASNDCK
jgi:hypothetical protein